MGRLARGHVEERLRERFPGRIVQVEQEPGGLRIEIRSARGGSSLIAITSDKPGGVLAALLAAPDREGQE